MGVVTSSGGCGQGLRPLVDVVAIEGCVVIGPLVGVVTGCGYNGR